MKISLAHSNGTHFFARLSVTEQQQLLAWVHDLAPCCPNVLSKQLRRCYMFAHASVLLPRLFPVLLCLEGYLHTCMPACLG